jgi:hypothetical protein
MSTNYYIKLPPQNECEHCKRHDEQPPVHIGKYSHGWKFVFNALHRQTFKEWLTEITFTPHLIIDEYGVEVSKSQLIELISSTIVGGRYANDGKEHSNPSEDEYLDGGLRFFRREFC